MKQSAWTRLHCTVAKEILQLTDWQLTHRTQYALNHPEKEGGSLGMAGINLASRSARMVFDESHLRARDRDAVDTIVHEHLHLISHGLRRVAMDLARELPKGRRTAARRQIEDAEERLIFDLSRVIVPLVEAEVKKRRS